MFFNKKNQASKQEYIFDDAFFNNLREKEFKRLEQQNQVYLDYTGGNLYPDSLLNKHFDFLKKSVLGNPHSTNPSSKLATLEVEKARAKVIEYFNAEDYFCIFTANASASLQIIGECYPFKNGQFLLTADNHNSVNGIREYCHLRKGDTNYSPINFEDLSINETALNDYLNAFPESDNKLFAFPAQSNVSGVKHNLNWIEKAQQKGWDVLLDAAAFVPTSRLDLKTHSADFVSVSFYKIFGYPTGLGCLFVKKSKFNKLVKPWFAGGTVSLVSVNFPGYQLIENHERFENGTVNYLDIPAIKNGLDYIELIGIDRINKRITALTSFLIDELQLLLHQNGNPLIKLFGPTDCNKKGGTIIFNVLDDNGNPLPYGSVEELANQNLISLRTGCFCNPGIDEVNNCITEEELAKYYSSSSNANYQEMLTFLGKMRGAIRISVGIATTHQDLVRFISFLKNFLK